MKHGYVLQPADVFFARPCSLQWWHLAFLFRAPIGMPTRAGYYLRAYAPLGRVVFWLGIQLRWRLAV